MMERHLIPAFTGGEIDPMMQGRVDTDNYALGLETAENFVALALGPLVKRQGFEFIRPAAVTAGWLAPFRFSVTQEYVIEWSDGAARFYTNGERIESGPTSPYELTLPYSAAEASALSLQQSKDRLYINHPDHAPAAILRTAATTFAFETLTLNNGPFQDDNGDESVTVTVTGTLTVGGSVTISASSPIFAAGHVGGQFRVQAKDFSDIKAWEPGMSNVAIGDVVRSDGKAYTALTSGSTGSVQPTHTEGSAWDGLNQKDVLNAKGPYGVEWEYRHDRIGTMTISGFTDAQTVTATVDRRIPDSVASVATSVWAKGCFSDAEGWPSLVALGWGRRIDVKDFDVIGSVVGDYGGGQVNYSSFTDSGLTTADLSFRRRLATDDVPVWIAFDRKLLVGTPTRELAIGPTNAQAAVSGDNISADPQSFYGSESVAPVQVGISTLFIERGGRRIRASGYQFAQDRYVADDITAAARHVTAGGISQLAWQRVPYPMVLACRGDGQIIAHSDNRDAIKGFSRFVLGGGARALSIASVVGADGKTDELWVLVERTAAAGTVREVWRQTGWRELGDDRAECFFVDGGVRIEASGGQDTFTGLAHLAGQDVAVLADGAVVPGMAVDAGGTLVLPAGAVPEADYVCIVGLAYTATATTLAPEFKTRTGTAQGLKKRVRKLLLRLLETMGIRAGQPTLAADELIDRNAHDFMDAPVPLFSGDASGPIDSEFGPAGQVTFSSSVPLPAVITAAMMTIETDESDA